MASDRFPASGEQAGRLPTTAAARYYARQRWVFERQSCPTSTGKGEQHTSQRRPLFASPPSHVGAVHASCYECNAKIHPAPFSQRTETRRWNQNPPGHTSNADATRESTKRKFRVVAMTTTPDRDSKARSSAASSDATLVSPDTAPPSSARPAPSASNRGARPSMSSRRTTTARFRPSTPAATAAALSLKNRRRPRTRDPGKSAVRRAQNI